jgi:hypothetical protein
VLHFRAYERRRGWMAWHTAVLNRFDFEHGFPTLATLTGDAGPGDQAEQSDETLRHNIRLWKATLGQLGPQG